MIVQNRHQEPRAPGGGGGTAARLIDSGCAGARLRRLRQGWPASPHGPGQPRSDCARTGIGSASRVGRCATRDAAALREPVAAAIADIVR
jgi:hypothetical protein